MGKEKRLLSVTQNHLFKKAYVKGRSFVSESIAVYILRNGRRNETRTGITVSTKRGNAVMRVRLRRIIREALRDISDITAEGYIIIVVARQGAVGKKSTDILLELTRAFKKAGILKIQSKP